MTPLSSCCKAPVKRTDVSNGEFIGYNAFVCDECDMPCSIDHPPTSTGHRVEGEAHIHCFAGENPHRCASCCECGESFRNATNTTPVIASTVEELRKEFYKEFHVVHMTNSACITYPSVPYNWTEFNNGDERKLPEDIFNWFITHVSTSDSTLREVRNRISNVLSSKYEGIERIDAKLENMIMHCLSDEYDDSPRQELSNNRLEK